MSMTELVAHYEKLGIDYVKTKSGNPNMSNKQNKETQKLLRSKKESNINKINENECIICTNIMKGIAQLECGHSFCIKCTIQHFRTKDNCPLCRTFICEVEIPNKKSIDEINVVIEDILSTEYDTRNNLNMHDYIVEQLQKVNSHNVHFIAYDIMNEINLSCLDIGVSI